jgi:hypothetical protein
LRSKLSDEGSLARHVNAGLLFRSLLNRHSALNLEVCTTLYAGDVLSVDRWIGLRAESRKFSIKARIFISTKLFLIHYRI